MAPSFNGTFLKAFAFLLGHEGGDHNDAADPGGRTKYGVSTRWFPDVDMDTLTLDGAAELYRDKFWKPYRFDQVAKVHARLGIKLLDTAIWQGPAIAVKVLQVALNDVIAAELRVDGLLGAATIGAVARAKETNVLASYAAHLINVVERGNPAFVRGWVRRAMEIPPW